MRRREESTRVVDGSPVIELLLGESDSALLIEDLPVAVVWTVASQTSQQYYLRAYDSSALDERMSPLRELLMESASDDLPLADQYRPLLRMFPNGPYTLLFEPSSEIADDDHSNVDIRELWSSWQFMDWAGLHSVSSRDGLLLGSRPREFLDPEQISLYEEQIRSGGRPVILVAGTTATGTAFILDGHHKLEAYRRARVTPTALFVLAESPRVLDVELGCQLIQDAYARCADIAAAHYRAVRSVSPRAVDSLLQ